MYSAHQSNVPMQGQYMRQQSSQPIIWQKRPGVQTILEPSLSQSNFRTSKLMDHNIYNHTDRLYEPLRSTLNHPQGINPQIPSSLRHSYVTQSYKYLSQNQVEHIRNNVLIPKDVDLQQTNHFYKVQDKQFVAIDAQQRIIGKSISTKQMERIKNQGVKRSIIVYDLKTQPKVETIEKILYIEPKTTYCPPPIQTKSVRANMIDQPMNWIRESGCKGANWCTSNEVIASKNKPQLLKWLQ